MSTKESYPARDHYQGSVAGEYLDRRSGSRKWALENEAVARLLKRLPPGASVLDAPIGTSRFHQIYAELKLRPIGLDLSLAMLRQAQLAMRGSLLRADVARLPFDDDSVDHVLSMRFLNWLPATDLEAVLSEFRRVAREGLVVGIRARERMRPAHTVAALRSFARRPLDTAARLSAPLRRRLSDGPPSILIPAAGEVRWLFDQLRLEVVETETIIDGTEYSRRLFRYTPLSIYYLRTRTDGQYDG